MIRVGGHFDGGQRTIVSMEKARPFAINAMQIFACVPTRYWPSVVSSEDAEGIRAFIHQKEMSVVVHSPYLINMGDPVDVRSWRMSSLSLSRHMSWASRLGFYGVVTHIGSAKGSMEQAWQNVRDCILDLFAQDDSFAVSNAFLLLENSPGSKAGTKVGADFDGIVELINSLPTELQTRVGVCWDTAHAFAAGYDVLDQLKVLTSSFVRVVHFNNPDMDVTLGSHIDHHASVLDEGSLPLAAMKSLWLVAREKVCILEGTPDLAYDLHHIYSWELEVDRTFPVDETSEPWSILDDR